MSNVTSLPNRQQLTSAHRCLLWRIQDLCIDISQRSDDVTATYNYCGSSHVIDICVFPHGVPRVMWSEHVYLPGAHPSRAEIDTSHALEALATLHDRLEAYLPNAGGAA